MNTLARTALLSAAAIVLLALAAPTVLAQVPQPGVTLTLAETTAEFGPSDSTRTITGTVAYSDTAPAAPGGTTSGNVDLAVTAPDGWTATIEPASFALSNGESADFTITLTAPTLEEGTQTTGAADVTANAAGAGPGGRSATATASVTLTANGPPIVPPPWYQTPGGIAAIIGAIILLLGTIIAIAWNRRNKRIAAEKAAREAAEKAAYLDRETGITIALADGPLQYGHKREVVYRLTIKNTSPRPRVALVDIVSVTNGWRAATQLAKIPLTVGETQPVTLVVTPDAVITPGDRATVIVRTRPEEARERDERLTVDVVAPKAGVPNDPHYKIVSVHREGAGQPTAQNR